MFYRRQIEPCIQYIYVYMYIYRYTGIFHDPSSSLSFTCNHRSTFYQGMHRKEIFLILSIDVTLHVPNIL